MVMLVVSILFKVDQVSCYILYRLTAEIKDMLGPEVPLS